MAAPKVRVPVASLIEAIESHKKAAAEAYEKALADYEDAISLWEDQVWDGISAVWEALATPKVWNVYVDGRYRQVVEIPNLGERPVCPSEPDYGQADRDLGLLRAAQEETLTISSDSDLARYP